jgi:hypothetical protein
MEWTMQHHHACFHSSEMPIDHNAICCSDAAVAWQLAVVLSLFELLDLLAQWLLVILDLLKLVLQFL